MKSTLLFLAVALSPAAKAHHSFQAEYDQSKPLTLVGRVTKVVVENPHGWVYLEVKREDGRTTSWQIETPAPNVLSRSGVGKDILNELIATGEQVTVSAYAARDESKHGWGSTIKRQDGQTVIRLGDNTPGGTVVPRN